MAGIQSMGFCYVLVYYNLIAAQTAYENVVLTICKGSYA